jgi:phosphoribosyl 1,2-cyclic phosphodiesterase
MKVKFWGVRGSIPTPPTADQIRNKIAAVVQRIENKDLESPESREYFLSQLPPYIFGTVGGNTTCIETRLSDDSMVIFDAGSGLRELGYALKKRRDLTRHYHIFFTHFHWDHLQGLPFFAALSDKNAKITFYSPVEKAEEFIRDQMRYPYFPVTLDVMPAQLEFVLLTDQPFAVGGAEVSWREMKHPGGAVSYRIEENGKTMIFSTDTELSEGDFEKSEKNSAFYSGSDLLIMDAQYTLGEALEKYDWGHSSYSLAVDFSSAWNIANLVLFHHEPLYDDSKMYGILKSASWYLEHLEQKGVRILLAREQMELDV